MYCFIYVLWFVFPIVVIQTCCRWIIFKTSKSKILSSSSSKASEPLNNSAHYFFLALFTIYVMHEIMNSSMFIFPHLFLSDWFCIWPV
jgi:hypothetical protein